MSISNLRLKTTKKKRNHYLKTKNFKIFKQNKAAQINLKDP